VTLYELGNNLVPTGHSFPGMTDEKGSFEIKGIELASPYALLKADGYYRNEVTGKNSVAQITLYAIADMSNKSNANVNILTHLEYYRVQTLVQKGKSFADAKKQALGEILAIFSIDGNNFKGSEEMSIFGTGDSDAALLAISVLLQGELSEGSFLALLADFSQKLKDNGAWDNKAKKAEMAEWASSADLAAIRGNIVDWGLSANVPDFEKYIRSYKEANSGTSGCIGLNSENEFCHNGYAYPKCGDENGLGKYDYNPETQFCHNNYTVGKCGGKVYEPPDEQCSYNVIEKRCGTAWYNPSRYYCHNGSLSSCGNLPLRPDEQFCYGSTIYDKCGGTVTFTPVAEACCGSVKYTLATHSCHNGQTYSCGNLPYDPSTHFCLGTAITPLCGGQKFESSQFCSGNTVYGKCGGTVTYVPGAEACCGNNKYTVATHSCHNGQTYSCGNLPYNPSTQFCLGGTVTPLCGGQTFTGSQFCSGNVRYYKCGGTVEYIPGTEDCCGSNKYTIASQFCYDYNKVGEYCGNRTEIYNPDLYECREGSKIYLKEPVSYGGESYEAVLIGTQTWMAKDLNYENYNPNGSSVCYDINCNTRAYDWLTAMDLTSNCNSWNLLNCSFDIWSKHKGVCPYDWHIPSDNEWDMLMTVVGGINTAGAKLKATSGWDSCGPSGSGNSYLCEDTYGFSALPGGGSSDRAGWWVAKKMDSYSAYRQYMSNYGEYAGYDYDDMSHLNSVRCLQD
jgi:uncharacterized protein (TIGR02145 family)